MVIVAVDKESKEVQRWVKDGVKNIFKVELSNDFRTVTFIGQEGKSFDMTLEELMTFTNVMGVYLGTLSVSSIVTSVVLNA